MFVLFISFVYCRYGEICQGVHNENHANIPGCNSRSETCLSFITKYLLYISNVHKDENNVMFFERILSRGESFILKIVLVFCLHVALDISTAESALTKLAFIRILLYKSNEEDTCEEFYSFIL